MLVKLKIRTRTRKRNREIFFFFWGIWIWGRRSRNGSRKEIVKSKDDGYTRYLRENRIWWALRSRACPNPWKSCNLRLLDGPWSRKPYSLRLFSSSSSSSSFFFLRTIEKERARVPLRWRERKRGPTAGKAVFGRGNFLLFKELVSARPFDLSLFFFVFFFFNLKGDTTTLTLENWSAPEQLSGKKHYKGLSMHKHVFFPRGGCGSGIQKT